MQIRVLSAIVISCPEEDLVVIETGLPSTEDPYERQYLHFACEKDKGVDYVWKNFALEAKSIDIFKNFKGHTHAA